jgi:hypothetical protein
MKILHALVGYLTVTALPFSPFAFAHPLAASIDYDGFVNSRQNQNVGTVMKRVPGDIIETRQLEGVEVVNGLLVIAAVAVIAIAIAIIWTQESSDKPVRGNEVELLVDHFD